jgi:hypothetical protein
MRYQQLIKILLFSYILTFLTTAGAVQEPRDQLKRIHDRITGVHPDEATLQAMESAYSSGYVDDNGVNHPAGYEAAAYVAIDHPAFYNVTLKNMVTPWTNEAQTIFDPLNDYTATVIGIVRDDRDFREILSGDILYTVGNPDSTPPFGLPAYSRTDNDHYADAEQNGIDLKANLYQTTQSNPNTLGLPSTATAGVMTTRAAAKAFFVDGTNRAMFRFTILNHFCNDLEYYKDVTGATDRIRQDVSRSPGGDSRIYLNNCVGCHAGMDPMAQAFAYYDYQYDATSDPEAQSGQLVYTAGSVQPKYLINANNFKWGFATPDDSWTNYWRKGPNSVLGWNGATASGNGAKSLGAELASSDEFASCQVKKVFKTVCLRAPANSADRTQVSNMTTAFKTGGYNLKQSFAQAAAYCLIPTP